MNASVEQLIPQQDAAKLLGISPVTLRAWIRRGDLAAVKLGKRRVFVKKSVLAEFIASAPTVGRSAPLVP